MKKHIIFLIAVLVFALIILPTFYFIAAKLRTPIQKLVSKSAPGVENTNRISQNYVPAPTGQMIGERSMGIPTECVLDDLIIDEYRTILSLTKDSETKALFRSTSTGMTMFFDGFKPKQETSASARGKGNTISFVVDELYATTTSSNFHQEFVNCHDGGTLFKRFLDIMNTSSPNGYDLTDKGIVTINNLSYYWYLFEAKDRIYKNPGDTLYYGVIFSGLSDNKLYTFTGLGTSKQYGTARDFLTQHQIFLSGVRYATSTTSVQSIR